ncbi:MAG: hypothetical protein K8J08_18900 [Thermoanaerobaculia bacterium]|nr:hypothetical protein [Thermoanaerobaculia bacterium]
MDHPEDRQLIARLLGELDPEAAAEVDRQRRRDPRLEQRYQLLLGNWNALDLAPPPAPLAGSAQRMLAQQRTGRVGGGRFRVLGQLFGGAAALATGLALGIGLGIAPTMLDGTTTAEAASVDSVDSIVNEVLVAESLSTESSSLSDAYWQLVSKDLP